MAGLRRLDDYLVKRGHQMVWSSWVKRYGERFKVVRARLVRAMREHGGP